jgi:hypothetical protein
VDDHGRDPMAVKVALRIARPSTLPHSRYGWGGAFVCRGYGESVGVDWVGNGWPLASEGTNKEETVNTQYFTDDSYTPKALVRRTKDADEAFVNGVWRSTSSIVDYNAGHNDFVDDITEDGAHLFAPAAFA